MQSIISKYLNSLYIVLPYTNKYNELFDGLQFFFQEKVFQV